MNLSGSFRNFIIMILLAVSSASLVIPASLISPFTIPNVMEPNTMDAVKLAVGTRMLGLLGSTGIGSAGSLATSILGGGGMDASAKLNELGMYGFGGSQQLTPRNKNFSKRRGPNIPTSFNIREATPTEVENFFGVLHRVDANKCISRLVCEVGANPKVLEGLGHNVKEVISSLQVLEKNALSTKYRNIMIQGQRRGFGSCARTFRTCDNKSYRMVRTFVRAFRINK